jgi:hypothetical protein
MPRTLSWRNRLHEIAERVCNSAIETWTRQDLEAIFEIRRVSAQTLMKAIGEIQSIGGKHFVSRAALLEFLEDVEVAESPESATRDRRLFAQPVPRPRRLKLTIPEELRSVMVVDLPAGIALSAGRIVIAGETAVEIIERLLVLARALENDLDTALELLEPTAIPPPVDEDDFKPLFESLRRREASFHS